MEKTQNFMDFAYGFYRTMKEHKITLVYEGEITHQLTKAFTSLAESDMSKGEESGTVQKRVFHVMVECLQNLSKHADDAGINDYLYSGRGLFIVSKDDHEYAITTGNAIENSKIETLKAMLENINSLDKEALNELYKKQMKEGVLSAKGGAGLGLIDIARKTGNRLEYHFLYINDSLSFFLLTSKIPRV